MSGGKPYTLFYLTRRGGLMEYVDNMIHMHFMRGYSYLSSSEIQDVLC